VKFSPEYEDCRRIAADKKIELRKVYELAQEKAKQIYAANH
jgi:uncharacterized protein (DUF111 family)